MEVLNCIVYEAIKKTREKCIKDFKSGRKELNLTRRFFILDGIGNYKRNLHATAYLLNPQFLYNYKEVK